MFKNGPQKSLENAGKRCQLKERRRILIAEARKKLPQKEETEAIGEEVIEPIGDSDFDAVGDNSVKTIEHHESHSGFNFEFEKSSNSNILKSKILIKILDTSMLASNSRKPKRRRYYMDPIPSHKNDQDEVYMELIGQIDTLTSRVNAMQQEIDMKNGEINLLKATKIKKPKRGKSVAIKSYEESSPTEQSRRRSKCIRILNMNGNAENYVKSLIRGKGLKLVNNSRRSKKRRTLSVRLSANDDAKLCARLNKTLASNHQLIFHDNNTIMLCLSGDKGGGTTKLGVTIGNCLKPNSASNFLLIGMYSGNDTAKLLREGFQQLAQQINLLSELNIFGEERYAALYRHQKYFKTIIISSKGKCFEELFL